MQRRMILIAASITVMLLAVLAALLLGYAISEGREQRGAEAVPETKAAIAEPKPIEAGAEIPESVPAETDGYISLPGFEKMTFRAQTTRQTVKLYNPEQNNCYFLASIILPDGREVYRSEMLAPGDTVSDIQVNAPLPVGTYANTVLQYSCYDLKNLQTMTGASIKFTLEVIP